MKSQDFIAWTEATGLTSARQVSEALDASRNTIQRWFVAANAGEDVPIKRTTALAMSAIYHRIPSWDERT